MSRFRWSFAVALLLSALCDVCVSAETRTFKAGAVVADITPLSFPVEVAGSMSPILATETHDALSARCLVLDNGKSVIAMVVCDSCMIPRDVFDAAKQLASQKTGIPSSHIVCSATHSHSAVCATPIFQSKPNKEYLELLKTRIAEGVQKAFEQREPAKIGCALGNVPQHVFNRRWFLRPDVKLDDPFDLGIDKVRMNPQANHTSLVRPAGPTDPQLPILVVQAVDGRPIALWANYSLHYIGGVPGKSVSADYFGEFAKQIGEVLKAANHSPPFVAAMTNGTSADINNINFFEGTTSQPPFGQIQRVSADIAKAASIAYQRTVFLDWVPLEVRQEEIELGVRKPDATEIARAKELLASGGPGPWSDRRLIYASETLHMSEYPNKVPVMLQAIRIGDLGIATTPCETFVETGLAIKQESPFPITFTIELANGYNGYLPTPEQHALGGYETWRAKSSYLTVDAEPRVRSTLLKLLHELARE
jgi:neutral ceramidase